MCREIRLVQNGSTVLHRMLCGCTNCSQAAEPHRSYSWLRTLHTRVLVQVETGVLCSSL